jgi:Protein of unknown function (DUF962)
MTFFETLREQRWDDHRFYHHSRINQSLHFISAISFVCAYALVWTHPAAAVLLGWIVGMTTRQAGHFFFEPKEYDKVNQATHEHKEEVKVGYNLVRKYVLMGSWALTPALLYLSPSLFGLLSTPADWTEWLNNLALMWIGIAVIALALRTAQLCIRKDAKNGFAWLAKILTDPFHDIYLYHKAPLALLRGELIDPMHAQHRH